MAVPRTFTDASIALAAGQQFYPSASGRNISIVLGQGYVEESISFDVGNYASTDQLDFASEYSIDNWQTVIPGGETKTIGGIFVGKNGATTVRSLITELPQVPANSTLLQRFNITAPSANTITNVSLTLS